MEKVKRNSKKAGLTKLALSFVLPHENKPMRLPVVPAALTALLDTMADATMPVSDQGNKLAFLCRDPAYPLWVGKSITAMSWFLRDISVAMPGTVNTAYPKLLFTQVTGFSNSGTIDGVLASSAQAADLGVVGRGGDWIYVPKDFALHVVLDLGVAATAGTVVYADLEYMICGERRQFTLTMNPSGNQFWGTGTSGASTGPDTIPYGFVRLLGLRSGTNTQSISSVQLYFGWGTGSWFDQPTGTKVGLFPFSMPPEFNNSVLPYTRTRLNSSAALFTNVTAALSKEGTILAGRLKQSVVEPWDFTSNHINSVHPSLRYYGALEKGLYTFTTPNADVDMFDDCSAPILSNSAFNATHHIVTGKQIGRAHV